MAKRRSLKRWSQSVVENIEVKAVEPEAVESRRVEVGGV
jgi:hypothetical protein